MTITSTRASKTNVLRRREFMEQVKRACVAELKLEEDGYHSRSTINLLKIHFNENYRIHYELMISAERGIIELGLHFEDGPESTSRLLEFFDLYVLEIKHKLGEEFELERWTKSWGHAFEVHAMEPLTSMYAQELGVRLAEVIAALQPMLDDAVATGVASNTPRPGGGRRRFRR